MDDTVADGVSDQHQFSDPALGGKLPTHFRLSLLVFYLYQRRETALDRMLAPLGVSVGRWRTLLAIHVLEGCTMSDLARYCCIDRTTLTRTIDRMAAEGLVVRSVPPSDRRQVVLDLTDKGRALFGEALAPIQAFGERMATGIDEDEQRRTADTLEKMLGNMFPDPAAARDLVTVGRSSGRSHRTVL